MSRKGGLQSFCKDLYCGKRKKKNTQGWVRHNLGTADAAFSGQSGLFVPIWSYLLWKHPTRDKFSGAVFIFGLYPLLQPRGF